MLDSQRRKYAPAVDHRSFARTIVLIHFAVGLCCTALLVFHELFAVSIAVFIWFLITVGLVIGMMGKQEWCRPLLAVMFFALAAAGFYYLTRVLPETTTDRPPILTHKILPLWGTTANLAYFIGGVVILASPSIKKATARGFALW